MLTPNVDTKCRHQMLTPQWTANLPSKGACGRNGYITPAFFGADCLVRGGKNRHGRGPVKKRCLARARRSVGPCQGTLENPSCGGPVPRRARLEDAWEGCRVLRSKWTTRRLQRRVVSHMGQPTLHFYLLLRSGHIGQALARHTCVSAPTKKKRLGRLQQQKGNKMEEQYPLLLRVCDAHVQSPPPWILHSCLNPNPGRSLTLDLLCEHSADSCRNFGHKLKKILHNCPLLLCVMCSLLLPLSDTRGGRAGGGGGGLNWPPQDFWLTHPPSHISEVFLRKKMKFIKGGRTCRSLLETQTLLASDPSPV